MKIRSVEAIPFSLPFSVPRRWARGALEAADHVLVRVTTDDGLVGQAEAPPRPTIYGESQRGIVAAIEDWLGPMLVGSDPWQSERSLQELAMIAWNPTAKAALDMALADLRGQAAGQPVWKLLGGWSNRVAVSWRATDLPVDQQVEACLAVRERYGINAFKIKVGMQIEQDVDRIVRLRRGLGPAAQIALDANQGWDAATAVRVLEAARDQDVLLVEEPCPIEDDRGRLLVAARTSIPLMGDESCTSLLDVRRQVELGAVRVISIKTARTGFHQSWKIAHLCEQYGIVNLCGMQADTSIGNVCSLHFAAACPNVKLPSENTCFLDTADELLVTPPVIRDGFIELSDRPGLGLEIDREKLARYRV